MIAPPSKAIPPRERLILALDVGSPAAARRLVEELGDHVGFFKIGLALFMCEGYFELLRWLTERGKKVFVDLKFFDVPQTVGSAVANLRGRQVTFATVHGNQAILEAACAEKGDMRILGVTVLTSMDRNDLVDLGFPAAIDVPALVLSRARRACRRLRRCRRLRPRGRGAAPRARRPAARRRARHPAVRQCRRPEAHRRCRAGLPQRRRLHRGGPAHPQGAIPTAAAAQVQERIAAFFAAG